LITSFWSGLFPCKENQSDTQVGVSTLDIKSSPIDKSSLGNSQTIVQTTLIIQLSQATIGLQSVLVAGSVHKLASQFH